MSVRQSSNLGILLASYHYILLFVAVVALLLWALPDQGLGGIRARFYIR